MSTPSAAVQHRLFGALKPSIRALAEKGRLRSFRKNTVIITEGDQGDSTYVLMAGRVRVFSNDALGHELTFGVVDAGDYFAEMWLDGGPRSASIITLEACICSVIDRDELRHHLATHADFTLELLARMIGRARAATQTARELALKDVYGRVVSALEGFQGPGSPSAPVLLSPITHQAIASRVGASREMVSRLLKDLERGGYVTLGFRQITLHRKLPARW